MRRQKDKKPGTGEKRVPVADDEDFHSSVSGDGSGIYSLHDDSERIKLQSYDNQAARQERNSNIQETSYILDERPPVEGRDSLGKDKVDTEGNLKQQNINELHSASYVPPSWSNIATVRELRCERPKVEPLPLLQNDDRVDLGSPGSHNVSPFTKTKLFTDENIESPLSDVVADDMNADLEYDDYMPELPGSYFTMDPQAYTLTWSKQPLWTHQPDISHTASDTSVDRNVTTTEQH